VLDSSVGAAAKIIKQFLHEDQQTTGIEQTESIEDRFYPYPNDLNLVDR